MKRIQIRLLGAEVFAAEWGAPKPPTPPPADPPPQGVGPGSSLVQERAWSPQAPRKLGFSAHDEDAK